MNPFTDDAQRLAYQALTDAAGMVDFTDRTKIELRGGDRVKFLQNLCTADIAKLDDSACCEAFITSVQGKILGFVHVFREPDRLLLTTVPGQTEKLMKHLDKYLIREEVEIRDVTHELGMMLLAGKQAGNPLARAAGREAPEVNRGLNLQALDDAAWLWRVPLLTSDSFLAYAPRQASDELRSRLAGDDVTECDAATFEIARIEAGWPRYDVDITDANLPQEVGRDAAAISFTKGCYLGQETVARIDAIGHVNKQLVGLRIEGEEVPSAGVELSADDKQAGTITSAAFSPQLSAPLALGYVRTAHVKPGSRLSLDGRAAEVVQLPV